MTENVHFGGKPTQPDVTKLVQKFGESPAEGTQFKHAEIEAVIGTLRSENISRYRVVTNAWRRYMLSTNGIEIGAIAGIGFEVLTDADRVTGGINDVRKGARKQYRAINRVAIVKTDKEGLLRKQVALNRYGMALKAEMTGLMNQIEPPKSNPAARVPMRQPPNA